MHKITAGFFLAVTILFNSAAFAVCPQGEASTAQWKKNCGKCHALVTIKDVKPTVWMREEIVVKEDDDKQSKKLIGGTFGGGAAGAVAGALVGGPFGAVFGWFAGTAAGSTAGMVAGIGDKVAVPEQSQESGFLISLNNGQVLRVKQEYRKGQMMPLSAIQVDKILE